jgi:acetyl esterase/lipase
VWQGIDILERTPPQADKTLPYGPLPLQFGDLWLPTKPLAKGQRWPLLVLLHGGWWLAEYGLGYMGFLCQAMKAQGVAVWSLEYRRVGNAGGGWPGTMQDVAMGTRRVGIWRSGSRGDTIFRRRVCWRSRNRA